MKRLILFAVVASGLSGCGPATPTASTANEYKHSLKAAAPEDRLKAIEERQAKYGGAQK
jgi:hypothetical protein